MNGTLPPKDVVLLGAGHAHVQALRRWRGRPIRGARLTCVSNFSLACYSGMVAGSLAGQYAPERMQIDLVRLCAACGARLVRDAVQAVDIQRRELRFADRPPLSFDLLSIGVGSVPRRAAAEEPDELLLAIKPTQTFLPRLDAHLAHIAPRAAERPLLIVILGGDAVGLEMAFCLPKRIESVLGDVPWELTIV
jgi:selenide,water dikinase